VDCGCSPRFRAMAEATREYTASVLSAADKQFLRGLLSCAWRQVDSTNFFLCHATPSDLLYEYRPPASPLWDREEEASLGANFVLVGHTHLQFSRTARQQTIVNPGSLGQSKAGDPRERYAIWQDGRLELRTINYPVEQWPGDLVIALVGPGVSPLFGRPYDRCGRCARCLVRRRHPAVQYHHFNGPADTRCPALVAELPISSDTPQAPVCPSALRYFETDPLNFRGVPYVPLVTGFSALV
jgi:hypothetical protein